MFSHVAELLAIHERSPEDLGQYREARSKQLCCLRPM